MRRNQSKNTRLVSLVLILMFFGIRMMLPNALESNEIKDRDIFEAALVVDVIDGDTIWVNINGEKKKIRFIGVDTPEKNQPFYQEATDYTTQMLLNKLVYLEKDISERDQYGRLLRYIWLEIPLTNTDDEKRTKLFNSMLVENGYARILVYRPDVKYEDYYEGLLESK